jgi:RNA polymerase sigma factor (sigma-70 family)
LTTCAVNSRRGFCKDRSIYQKPKAMANPFDINPAATEKLLAKVLLGDSGANRTLADLLAPIIRRVAGGFALPIEVREDLIQEVWTHLLADNCRVLQKWDRRGPLINYVVVVALNLMRDRLAKAKTRVIVTEPIEDCADPADPDDPARMVEVRQLAECLEKAKDRLSMTHRDMIRMRHEFGFKHREIATKLGKSMGYVGATLARAERYLREEVMETCADHLGDFRLIF